MHLKEQVKVQYADDKITVKGDTFTAVLSISSSELSTVYWGNIGRGVLTLDVEDPVAAVPPASPATDASKT